MATEARRLRSMDTVHQMSPAGERSVTRWRPGSDPERVPCWVDHLDTPDPVPGNRQVRLR